MDFHSLARKELQALCKKNKIPANLTNLAMADALKALEIVEGIEEYLKPVESETAQSSIESPVKTEEMSPCVGRTVGRSTRRRNEVKDEPATLPSRTSTRRSTRKGVAGDETEKGVSTQSPAITMTTRRAQASMVRRKVEAQFDEEEIGKEKKTVPPTPAPLGTASRRKAVKDEVSTVRKLYSTRRSTRLAEKTMDTPKAEEDEKMGTLKHELFTGENLDKVLEINGVEEKKEKLDVVLEAEKEEKTEVEDPKLSFEATDESEVLAVENIENQSGLSNEVQENDGSHNMCVSEAENELENEAKLNPNKEDMESSDDFAKMDEEKLDESENLAGEIMENQSNLSNEVQENDGSHNICISEAENVLENGVVSSSYKEDMEANDILDDVLESGDDEMSYDAKSQNETMKETESSTDDEYDSEVDENSNDDDSEMETEKELKNEKHMDSQVLSDSSSGEAKIDLDVVKDVAATEEADIEFIDHSSTPVEQIELDLTEIFEEDEQVDEVSIAAQESLGEVSSDDETHLTSPKQIEESIENLETEQNKQDSDQVEVPMSTLISTVDPTKDDVQAYCVDVVQSTPVKKTPIKTPTKLKWMADVADNKENIGSGSKFFVLANEKVKTPSKTPKSTTKNITDVSDNKENLDSGKKILIQTKEKVKKVKGTTTEQDLNQFSLRKLNKMFKEKLRITNQSSINENNPKAAKETITSRPALQALPENQLVDEAQN